MSQIYGKVGNIQAGNNKGYNHVISILVVGICLDLGHYTMSFLKP